MTDTSSMATGRREAGWDGRLRLPRLDSRVPQDAEWFEVHERDRWQRLRFHDYQQIYARRGLYEHIFYELLECDSPRRIVRLLDAVRCDRGSGPCSALDLGAGNGIVGEELRGAGAWRVVGIDILAEARAAAERDRPWVYDDYIVDDLTQPTDNTRGRLDAAKPAVLTCVAALGFGDVPPLAFYNAANAIQIGGHLAFTIKEEFLDERYTHGFSELVRRMLNDKVVRLEAWVRYRHRLSVGGEPLFYTAIVATVIRFRGVDLSYASGAQVLKGVSLEVARGELLVLVGESGSGKTTTLKCINRLVAPTAGEVSVDGTDIASVDPVQLRRTIGMVFQRFALFPHMSVGDNVAVVPRLLGWPEPTVAARVDELLDLVGLAPDAYRARSPSALSGGQQQRVGVARALAAKPSILLMDEPFGALDPPTRDVLGRECRRLHDDLGLTTVLVTHDMVEALVLADRIAVMHAGEVLQVGPPSELLASPAHDRVAALLGWPRRQAEQLAALMDGAPAHLA